MRSTFWAKTPPKAGAAAWDTAAASSPYSLFGDGADRPGRCQRSGEPRVVDAFCVCELVEHPGPYADCPPFLGVRWPVWGLCWGLGFLAMVIGFFCYSGLVRGFFCDGATWGGFFATVPRGFFATVPACRGFFATVPRGFFATVPACRGFFASVPRRFFASVFTSRQGNFKTTKITAGKLRFFGISSYS